MRKKSVFPAALLIIAAVLVFSSVSGCGGGTWVTAPSPTPTVSPTVSPTITPTPGIPSVVSVTPANDAVDVEPDTTVTVTFSETMNPATINDTTFLLTGPLGSVAGLVTYDELTSTATFTPAVELGKLMQYTVTVTTGAESLSGVPMTADFTSTFTTRDGMWGTPEIIDGDAVEAYSPQVAVDTEGNAVAVWYQNDGSYSRIYSNRYNAISGTWGTAQAIASNIGNAYAPQVAVDLDGNAVAVWHQYDGQYWNIYFNRYDALLDEWGTAQTIEGNAGEAVVPQVAVDLDGNAVAVWCQWDGSYYIINSNRYDAALGTWGVVQTISDNTTDANFSQVAVDPEGNAVAVWYQFDGSHVSIYSNRYDAISGMWGMAQVIEGNTGEAYNPQVAVDPDGNAVAVWMEEEGGNFNIYSNRYDAPSDTWGTPQAIEGNTGNALDPQIAVDPSGNAVAVWHQYDGQYWNIYFNRYDALLDEWGTAQTIEGNTRNAFYPQVAVDPSGNAVAVWHQSDGSYGSIYSNRYNSLSGTWGSAQTIESNTGDAFYPQVAVDFQGNAVVVWEQNDGLIIWANWFR